MQQVAIPVLVSRQDTYSVASVIHDITVKIRPTDKEKIEIVKKMIRDYVDLDMIMRRM
jgi:BioD-like phosphotransacetylase family protein